MHILQTNAERDFIEIASSISKNPQSWAGWQALHINFRNVDEAHIPDCLIWTKSILESYLKDVEGHVYFCFGYHVHILCQNVSRDILEQAGHQICDFIFYEHEMITEYYIYDLARFGSEYYMKSGVCDETDQHILLEQQSKQTNDVYNADFDVEERQSINLQNCNNQRVLLVEDDAVTRWMVRNALKNHCEFATAASASKAYAMYNSFEPDLVFLDINLPDQLGTDVLDWIMRHDPGAAVVMFSGNNNLEAITRSLNAGAKGFIAKPFLRKDLLQYVIDT